MDFKKLFLPSAVLTAALTLIAYAMSLIGYPVQQLYSIAPVSAVSPNIGTSTLSFLAGYIPQIGSLAIPSIIVLWISAFLVLLVGGYLYKMLNLSVKGEVQRLAAEILLGGAVFYILIVGLVMQQWQTFLGLGIHLVLAAYLTAFGIKKLS